MPKIARVQLEDGRIARFEVADNATPEQVMQAAKSLSAPKPQAEKPKSFWQGVLEGVEPYAANAGRFINMLNPVLAGADLAAKAVGLPIGPTNAVNVADKAAKAALARSPYRGSAAGHFVGGVVGSLPSLAVPGGAIAQGAAAGVLGSNLDDPADVALNAAIGGVAGKAGQIVSRPLARATNAAARGIRNAVSKPAPVAQGLEPLGRDAAVRAARFKAVGVDKPTTGMVTRDPNAFSFERNTQGLVGMGEDLQQQIRDIESGLVEKGRQLVRDTGGSKGPEATGQAVQDALDTKRNEMQRVTGRLYDMVRETRGDEAVGAFPSLRGALDHPDMLDNATYDTMRTGLVRRLQRLGLADKDGGPIEGASATVKQAEDLRKFVRELGSTADPSVRRMRGILIDALDDDVVNAVGDDAFKAARASAKARFDEFSKTFAGRVADEGIAPERLTKRVLSDTTSLGDLRAMRRSLHTGTEEQIARGREAWRGLKAQALDDLLSASTDADSKLLGGKLAREFTGKQAKFRELLNPTEYKQLRRLVLASRDATVAPPSSTINYSGTAITQANLGNLFEAAKPQVKQGWLKFLAKFGARAGAHMAAGSIAPGVGNVAIEAVHAGASEVAASAAQQKAATAMLRKIQMARNPQEAAAALSALQEVARSNIVARKILDRLAKGGALIGSAAAGQTVPLLTGN